jgi:hypothetical protein
VTTTNKVPLSTQEEESKKLLFDSRDLQSQPLRLIQDEKYKRNEGYVVTRKELEGKEPREWQP